MKLVQERGYNLWYVELERKAGTSLQTVKEGPFLSVSVDCVWERVDDLISLYVVYVHLDGRMFEVVRVVDEEHNREGDFLEEVLLQDKAQP